MVGKAAEVEGEGCSECLVPGSRQRCSRIVGKADGGDADPFSFIHFINASIFIAWHVELHLEFSCHHRPCLRSDQLVAKKKNHK